MFNNIYNVDVNSILFADKECKSPHYKIKDIMFNDKKLETETGFIKYDKPIVVHTNNMVGDNIVLCKNPNDENSIKLFNFVEQIEKKYSEHVGKKIATNIMKKNVNGEMHDFIIISIRLNVDKTFMIHTNDNVPIKSLPTKLHKYLNGGHDVNYGLLFTGIIVESSDTCKVKISTSQLLIDRSSYELDDNRFRTVGEQFGKRIIECGTRRYVNKKVYESF